jgi:ribokinase
VSGRADPPAAPPYAVVGHVEWTDYAVVPRPPRPGEIVHASESLAEPAGGGAVAAVLLAQRGGGCSLFTALGGDELGQRAIDRLTELGVTVHAARREQPTRRAVTLIDANGERSITTLGPRLEPYASDKLPWELIARSHAAFLTAGDGAAGVMARTAPVLVATPRARDALRGLHCDALVYSAGDRRECALAAAGGFTAELRIATEGAAGGSWERADGTAGRYGAARLPGPLRDSYGAGDSFVAGLTLGLGRGLSLAEALTLAARCGAWCMTGRGPYGRTLPLPLAPSSDL